MESVVSSFWNNKKVFLTGHTGFKGSWLTLWLLKMGAQVTGYSLEPSTSPSLFKLANLDKDMNSIIDDVRNPESVEKALRDSKAEIIIHMAAQPLVRYSYENPIETYMTNVMGTVHVLEAARKVGNIAAIVNVTTDKCYDNKEWVWGYRENDRLGGYDPYSNSKACAEFVTSAYRQSFFNLNEIAKHGTGLASARAGNVIGGGDWSADRLLPDIFKALSKQQTVKIRSPKSVRPWQHVLEPLSGYLVLVQKIYEDKKKFSNAYNFGPNTNDTQDVKSIVSHIVSLWGPNAKYEVSNAIGPHEATLLKLDCSKAFEELNWSPRWSLSEALPGIVNWYKQVYDDNAKAKTITLNQIELYEKS